MKHVSAKDLDEAKTLAEEATAPAKRRRRNTRKSGDAAVNDEQALFRELLNEMDQGVVYWDPSGACGFISENVYEILEIDDDLLKIGTLHNDFIKKSLAKREISADGASNAFQGIKDGLPYRSTRTTKSRRRVLVSGRPRPDGSHLVTYTDISELKKNEAALATAKARAESAEAELSAQLDRIKAAKDKAEAKQRELERLSLIAAHAKDLIVITDATNHIEWANEAYRRHNLLDLEMDLIGKSARNVLVGPNTDPASLATIDDAVRDRRSVTIRLLCYKRDGEEYWMEQEITPVFNDRGEHTNFIMVGRDVTEKLHAEEMAEESRAFENAKRDESRILAEFNEWLQSSDSLDELIQIVSAFLEKLLPESEGAVYVYADDKGYLESVCSWPIDGDVSHLETTDCWAMRRGRGYFYGSNTVDFACDHVRRANPEGLPYSYCCLPIVAHGDTVGLLHINFGNHLADEQDTQKLANFCAEQISLAIANVTLREQLREQSTRDPLTGLYNRRYFLDYAKRELSRCAAGDVPAAFLSLDVDHFKKFNDNFGHDAGDMVLKSLAEILRKSFRDADVPCRLGGEEFIVLLSGADRELAKQRAEILRQSIESTTLRYGGRTLKVTSSIGIASFPDHGRTLDELMQVADDALYLAKDEGRNCVVEAPIQKL